MESKTLKSIRSGAEYDHLIPRATLEDTTVKRGATVSDTVKFIPQAVREIMWQAEKIAPLLKGKTQYETCSNIWHFLYEHVKYKKDENGKEQVRSFARLWHDRFKGVDCDCFTTSVLCLLAHHNIKGVMRITKYKQNHFQHIYVIVPTGKGDYITIDCVVDKFNYEEPYTEKKDFSMELQFLNGIEDDRLSGNVDAQEMQGWGDDMSGFGELGKLKFKMFRNKSSAQAGGDEGGGKKKPFQKLKNFAKKALNVVNKLNPATALLRAGILASMKLNIFKVPERLKWAYLTADEAKAKGADMSKFERLKKILTKIEGIFFTAGGNPENLKKAILSGRGNRNKEVNGLYGYDDMSGLGEYSSLPSLLGATVYQDEFVNGLDGTDGLGSAVASGAAIASATTVMTAIAALLKSVGSMFPKKGGDAGGGEGGGEGGGDAGASADASDGGSGYSEPSVSTSSGGGGGSDETSGTSNAPAKTNSSTPATTSDDSGDAGGGDAGGGDASKGSGGSGTTEAKGGIKEMWEKNKKWMKPLGIGLGAATVIYIGYRVYQSNQSGKPATTKTQAALNGFRRKKRKPTKGRAKKHNHRKSLVALM